jgi:hypothetical protein
MLSHAGEDDEDLIINNYTFTKGPDFVDSSNLGAPGAPLAPLTAIPPLNSNPTAPVDVYLNFLGDFTTHWGSYSNITTPVFDLDGDPTTFSSAELTAIDHVWQRVSEDFAPFNVNITTVDPGIFPNGVAMKVDIGGGGSWLGTPAGGVAYIDNFTSPVDNVVFVFPDSLGRNEKNIAEASSHETGHAFGLQHQSLFDPNGIKLQEYNPGSAGWAPIMGNSYSAALSTWYNGTSSLGANVLQDDMAVISRPANGFGYRPDDHPDTVGSGTPLVVNGNTVAGAGVIETMTDVDAFSFTTDSGAISLSANVAPLGANLDAVLELRDAAGNLVALANPSDSLGASINMSVPAGHYTLLVHSTGTYGYVGQYTISGTINTGMFVAAHAPAETDVVSAPPVDFTITMSEPFDPATVDAGDLLINGVAADSATIIDATTIAFHYAASPVTAEGLQTMSMAEGALKRLSDASDSKPFNGSFRYDTLRPAITAIEPSGTGQLPLAGITVHLNEPYDPASISSSDLTLDRGSVTGFTLIDPTTIQFAVAGLDAEGPLGVQVAAGAITDPEGNPNSSFAATLNLDYGTVPYPAPLAAVQPPGSLIYDPAVGGAIGTPGDTDNFTLNLPAGQTVSLTLSSASSLQGQIELLDPGSAVIATATATGLGQQVVLGPIGTASGGLYTIAIRGVMGTTGSYSLQAVVNAAVETEAHGGPSNDTTATAQNIDSSFVNLGGSIARGAVIARSDPPADNLPSELEPNNSIATANNASRNFLPTSGNLYQLGIHGNIASSGDSDWIKIGLLEAGDRITITQSGSPSSRGTLGDAFVELWRGSPASPVQVTSNDDSGPGNDAFIGSYQITTADTYYIHARGFNNSYVGTYDLAVWLQNTNTQPFTGGNVTAVVKPDSTAATATDASTSWRPVQYLSQTSAAITTGDSDFYRFHFNAGDLVSFYAQSTSSLDGTLALFNAAGTQIAAENGESYAKDSAIYAYVMPTTGDYYVRVRASGGTGTYQLSAYLSAATPPPAPTNGGDDFSLTLAQGQSLSVALSTLSAGNLQVELLNALGASIATSLPVNSNISASINNFSVPAGGTYFLRVTGDTNVDYDLVVTRNGTFDLEPNNDPLAGATSLAGSHGALGYLDADPPSSFGNIAFTLDSTQSQIAVSGDFSPAHLPIVEQAPGSLVGSFQGQVMVERQADHVRFNGGSTIDAIAQPGPFLPGNTSADFAGQVILAPQLAAYALFQNVGIDVTSALLAPALDSLAASLYSGTPAALTFPANSLLFTLTSGTVSYQVLSLGGTLSLAGLSMTNQSNDLATLDEVNGALHMVIPIQISVSFTVPTLNAPITLNLNGQLVADYILPGPIDPVDYYSIELSAGQTLLVSTETPLDGPSDVRQNLLDPALEILAPDGTHLAGDDNSAGDGKNASLVFTAPAAGLYRVGVRAASGAGHYVLHTTLDLPPTANAGGPYHLAAGSGLQLDASASSDPDAGDVLSYGWDLNGDGNFGDATGSAPSLTWSDLLALGISADGSYPITLRVSDSHGLASQASTSLVIDGVAPRVTSVSLRSSGPNEFVMPTGGGEQFRSVPFASIQEISIRFSEDVHVNQNDLAITGMRPSYDVSSFSYNATTFTATWTLANPLLADHLTLALSADGPDPVRDAVGNHLDGEWTNPLSADDPSGSVFPSGNGQPGGDFVFTINILPGDSNRDGAVSGLDYAVWAQNYLLWNGNASYQQGDFNGDGLVTGVDYAIWAQNVTPISPPVSTAAVPPVSAVASSAPLAATSTTLAATVIPQQAPPSNPPPASQLAPRDAPRPAQSGPTATAARKLAFAHAVDELMHLWAVQNKLHVVRKGPR